MEGYSVTEAASVLGVPTERVWELLARGVLSGAPEGETGMRVYLQPRPAPVPPSVSEPRPSNGHGDGRGGEAEASPFRELLTEFRNLTERYGQALLALGEARGEVASLRSRVDVLEARMDLRLPFEPASGAHARGAPPSAPPRPEEGPTLADEAEAVDAVRFASEAPEDASERDARPAAEAPSRPAPEPIVESESDATAGSDDDAERSARRRRTRAHFVEEFAQALARAQDPSPSELPGSVEARAALAALQAGIGTETAPEADSPDATLPRELPAAEPMIEPEGQPQPAPAISEAESEPEAEAQVETAQAPALQPEARLQPEPESEAMPQPEPKPGAEPQPEPSPALAADVADDRVLETEPDALGAAEPAREPAADETWDRDRYTAVIEEPDWWTPDAAGWDDPLPQPQNTPEGIASEPVAAGIDGEPAEAETDRDTEAAPAVGEASDDVGTEADGAEGSGFAAAIGLEDPVQPDPAVEETVLWFGSRAALEPSANEPRDDPAAEMESATTTHRAPPAPKPLPGSEDLDAALAALAEPAGAPPRSQAGDDTRARALPRVPPAQADERPRTVELPSPASRAYRRLRRIFPS